MTHTTVTAEASSLLWFLDTTPTSTLPVQTHNKHRLIHLPVHFHPQQTNYGLRLKLLPGNMNSLLLQLQLTEDLATAPAKHGP